MGCWDPPCDAPTTLVHRCTQHKCPSHTNRAKGGEEGRQDNIPSQTWTVTVLQCHITLGEKGIFIPLTELKNVNYKNKAISEHVRRAICSFSSHYRLKKTLPTPEHFNLGVGQSTQN